MAQMRLSFWGKPTVELKEPPDIPVEETPILSIKTPESSQPEKPSLKVTLKLDPDKLKEVKPNRPKLHPFFQSRSYTVTKPTPQQSISQKSWSQTPISHVIPRQQPMNRLKRRKLALFDESPPLNDLYLYKSSPLECMRPIKQAKRALVDVTPRSAFDFGRYEREIWYQKHSPTKCKSHVNGERAKDVAVWLKEQFKALKTRRPGAPLPGRRKKSQFVVEDDEEDPFKPFLVVHGPIGSGKTAAVHTACNLFGALVLECNTSAKRTGSYLRELISGVSQSHVVHAQDDNKWYHCAVLIDEADINLDIEMTFWPTLKELAYKSKRPIVLTCENLDDLPLNVINEDTTEFVYMPRPDPVKVVDVTWKICTLEGFKVEKADIAKVAIIYNCDIRKVLAHMQFWLQWGVGGSPGGGEWFAKAHEQGRVISYSNYIEQPPQWQPSCEPQTLEELIAGSEQISKADAAKADTSDAYCRAEKVINHDMHGLLEEIPLESYTQLVTELVPFMRDIARDDLERARVSIGLRGSHRSLASFGLQRQVLRNPKKVLKTFSEMQQDSEPSAGDSVGTQRDI